MTGAVCSVFYRPYLVKYPPPRVSLFAMPASVLFLPLPAALSNFTQGGWLTVLFIGLASSLGY